uniref:Uncharacterized protein n=1 Tax=Rhizophora mucronata TaxID=61149 RepID=A0A2P2N8H0_RHIMU
MFLSVFPTLRRTHDQDLLDVKSLTQSSWYT